MSRARWLPLLLVAACPFLVGSWSLNFPTPGSYVPQNNASGTGNADVNVDFRYRILKQNGQLNGQVVSSTGTGAWYEYISGPLALGAYQKAQLVEHSSGDVMAEAYPVEVRDN
uniref:Uncharacterized protein n=1 Tax=Schlesneria paludicola TaxID=360056 RepID=A0A7C2JZ06_9PLAN